MPNEGTPHAAASGRGGAPRLASASAKVLAALLSFGVVAQGIGALVPRPTDYGLADKLAFFAAHRDDYDAVYLGSSRTFRSYLPEVVDRELRGLGHELRSFNLGVPGMTSFEVDHVLRDVLALRPQRLRWVILEPPSWDPELAPESAFSQRVVEWHTWRQTRAALVSIRLGDGSGRDRLALAWEHLRHAAWRLANYGQARRVVRGSAAQEPFLSAGELARHGGHRALEDVVAVDRVVRWRRRHFEQNAAEWRRRVDALEEGHASGLELGGYNAAALRSQLDVLRAAGVRPLYALPPTTEPMPLAFALEDAGHLPALASFCHPAEYPDLYRFDGFFDFHHLTRAGAEAFSRHFARAFAVHLDGGAE